jgi:uncharacterized membrane protein YoaK (UPF0700 family)
MKNLGPDAARDLLLLSFVAGSADAAGFMGLGRVFTSNMTGNLVLLGIALAQNHGRTALRTLYVLVMFSLGAAAGAAVARGLPDTAWRRLIVRLVFIETVLLSLFAAGWALGSSTEGVPDLLLACLALGMGVQSATLNRLTIAGVTSTAVTSTLTSLLTGLQGAWFAKRDRAAGDSPSHRRLGLQASVLLLYCTGALISGFLTTHARWSIGVAPVLCLLLVLFTHRKSALPSR